MKPQANRREFLQTAAIGAASLAMTRAGVAARPKGKAKPAASRLPNIVIIFTDDQGYADLGCFGAQGFETPNIDRMAAEGMRFTNFRVAQAVCSASRTGLLTGCYPNRVGILGALGPGATHGIADTEMTIAENLKQRGYATAIYGKYHLGHLPPFLPTRHGFDDYFGLPYSNDMWPKHPTSKFPDLPLMEGEKIIEYNPDQTQLTTWYTERAVKFIENNADRPFFLYVPHSMPHVPLFVSDRFKGKSKRGLYGDVIMEIDWSVGQILETLKRLNLDDNTWVIFTSDNGPWLSYGDHGGSAGPLREGKGTTWEGGVRVPCVMRWPGRIPAGTVCNEPAMTIDILPTIAEVVGTKLPDHKIDGLSIRSLVFGEPNARCPHEAYYLYWGNELQAVVSGKWKLHFPHNYRSLVAGGSDGKPGPYKDARTELALYDLDADIGEKNNVAAQHLDIVQRLSELGKKFDEEMSRTKREPGRVVSEKKADAGKQKTDKAGTKAQGRKKKEPAQK